MPTKWAQTPCSLLHSHYVLYVTVRVAVRRCVGPFVRLYFVSGLKSAQHPKVMSNMTTLVLGVTMSEICTFQVQGAHLNCQKKIKWRTEMTLTNTTA